MAFEVDPARLNPAILRALTSTPRDLTPAELSKLASELDKDPKKLGYRIEAATDSSAPPAPAEGAAPEGSDQAAQETAPPPSAPSSTAASALKDPQALAALLNGSGRTQELFGALIVEAADIMRATA